MPKSKPKRPKSQSIPDRQRGRHHLTAAGAFLVLILTLGVALYLHHSDQAELESDDPFAVSSPTLEQTSKGYAGPAAFTFTLENAALSPDGRLTAWSLDGNDVVMCLGVWDGQQPDLSQQISLKGHTAPIGALAFSSFGQTLASASADRTVKVWDVASGRETVAIKGHSDDVTAVAFSPDGVSLATGSRDQTIRLWDASGGLPMFTLQGHTDTVDSLAYSADGKLLASASQDKSIKIWDMEIGQEIATMNIGEEAPPRAMVFSPNRPVLATADGGTSVRLWDVKSGQPIDRLEWVDSNVLSVAFSPDGTSMAVAGVTGKILVKNLDRGEVLAEFIAPHVPLFVQFNSDGAFRWSRFSVEQLIQIGATGLVGAIATANKTAEKAIAGFGIPADFRVELFANESLVANPAAICTDDLGRIFVAETFRFDTEVMLGYAGREIWLLDDLASQTPADRLAMYEKYKDATAGGMEAHRRYSERIRRLEDRDGDGRADRARVFAEGFSDPLTGTGTGLISRGRDLYYTCIPTLWKLTDSDDDGTADQRQMVHTGFGVKASLPHGLHGLAWGPDGKLYFSIGDRGYHIETSGGDTLHNPATGAVLRCNADGSELEEVARGFRNPQELAFDQFGNLFTCDNNSNLGDTARLVYVLPGGDAGWQMSYETMPADYPLGPWNMDKMWETPAVGPTRTQDSKRGGVAAWILPPIAHVGVGPAGLAYYPGQGLPDRYEGHFFLCDFADAPEVSGVRSFAVQVSGAGFEIRDAHTFISNILPTDIEFGLDQKIYISDWIRGATSDGLGRIYTASSPERIDAEEVKRTQALFAAGFTQLTEDQLLGLLRHADLRVRQRAQFALADRGPDAISSLANVARQSDNLLARLHAIWALGIIGRQHSAALPSVASLLADPDPEVRGQAAKTLGEDRHLASADKLVTLLDDESLRVRSFAAQSLGAMQTEQAVDPILEMLRRNDNHDVFLRHAGVYALFRIGDADAVAAYADDDDPAVRLAVLLVLRRFGDDRISMFLDDPDDALVVEAARAIHDLPIDAALGRLAALVQRDGQSEPLLRRAINANFLLGTPEHARALTEFIANGDATEAMKREAIAALGDWVAPPPRDRVLGLIRPASQRSGDSVESVIAPWMAVAMDSADRVLQPAIMRAASKLKIELGDAEWITDARRDIAVRTQLLDMMAQRDDEQLQTAIDAALALDAPVLRMHAARILSRLDPSRAIDAISKILVDGTTTEKQFALTTLGTIQSPQGDAILIDWIGRLRSGEVPAALKYEVMSAASQRDNGLVQQELASLIRLLAQQPSIAERYQAVLEGGSLERGQLLFENHTSIQCLRCHTVNAKGGKVGPDLSKIGAKVSREYLLEALLAPELKIAEGFEGVTISTIDGRVLTGTLQQETEQAVQIIDADGKVLSLAKSEIEQRQGGKSVMPANLLQLITSSDVRDLVEYLASLK